ncbi:hypothetical protein HPB52_003126 [Rhipicephalus sanguineus]|uniref:Uncharacterized protein n=1 Tax=Rhipicephalus sanguineus TaxID=34632 RepID=A0A9D4SU71_RHISA|nr:hypothetical protein HPB52_003126 [Rhipicephalus sanguineus]
MTQAWNRATTNQKMLLQPGQLLTMLASAPCQEAQTDGFHLPSKGASNWNDTVRFSSWCLTSREQVVQGGPPTLLQSSSSAWNHAWHKPACCHSDNLRMLISIVITQPQVYKQPSSPTRLQWAWSSSSYAVD